MGYIRYFLLSFLCSGIGILVDGLISKGEIAICSITFFFIPLIYMVYRIYDMMLTEQEQKEENDNQNGKAV